MRKTITIEIDTTDRAAPIFISEDGSSGCKYDFKGEKLTDGVLNAFHRYVESQTDLDTVPSSQILETSDEFV